MSKWPFDSAIRPLRIRRVVMLSFRPECDDGIDLGGTARGNVRCEKRDRREQNGDPDECQRVSGTNPPKETRHKARDDERRGNANSHAEGGQTRAFAHDLTKDVTALGTERHANANLLCAARHGKRHNSVDAHRS